MRVSKDLRHGMDWAGTEVPWGQTSPTGGQSKTSIGDVRANVKVTVPEAVAVWC